MSESIRTMFQTLAIRSWYKHVSISVESNVIDWLPVSLSTITDQSSFWFLLVCSGCILDLFSNLYTELMPFQFEILQTDE